MIEGKITRISGPIVYAEGLDGCGLYDVVNVGEARLIGEIIRLAAGKATIQVYEDVTGMKIGEKVVCEERPLSVRLGPGLVGTIYDGIQRPLATMYKDGNACSLYVGYMRDEVYPFSISFRTSAGYKTPIFTLIPPPSEDARKEAESDSGKREMAD